MWSSCGVSGPPFMKKVIKSQIPYLIQQSKSCLFLSKKQCHLCSQDYCDLVSQLASSSRSQVRSWIIHKSFKRPDLQSPASNGQLRVHFHMTFVVGRVALVRTSFEEFQFHFFIYINLGWFRKPIVNYQTKGNNLTILLHLLI